MVSKTLRFAGLLRVTGEENIPDYPKAQMFVANHPSKLMQPLFILSLFSRYFKTEAREYVPRIAADIDNFVRKWPFTKASEWFIPVNRKDRSQNKCLEIANEISNHGLNQLWFPGGTRDWKATRTISSKRGKSMGRFRPGFAIIASANNLPVIPIWYERRWLVIYIVIGKPMTINSSSATFACSMAEEAVLSLADTVI